VLAGLAALMAVSLWITVPTVLGRALRRERAASLTEEWATTRKARRDLEARAGGLSDRALDAGDLLSRIAFLYDVTPARWPRTLNPESGVLVGGDPARIAQSLARYLSGLERGLALVAEREAADPSLPERTPALLPVVSDLVEPSAYFGPRVSPWTQTEEFFPGLELAAPAGSAVIAPAAGTVLFAGRVVPSAHSRLWRFGNLVVLSHGSGGATLFGHLARIDVRLGESVRRGQRLGSVGATGWAMSPTLHYQFWRSDRGEALAPTDPQFAILDRRFTRRGASLEKMLATSAPGPIEPPPGMN
jgi:murein DD-endopeptidase MepM/ murein hydrolase activator NlpD